MQVKALVATSSVDALRQESRDFYLFAMKSLVRFGEGDWGDICSEDKLANDEALADGYFILGSYDTDLCPEGKLWIVADNADEDGNRIVTLLFPSEY